MSLSTIPTKKRVIFDVSIRPHEEVVNDIEMVPFFQLNHDY